MFGLESKRPEFNIGDIVYLVTDPDQMERLVSGITLRPGGECHYCVMLGAMETAHYAIELTTEKKVY